MRETKFTPGPWSSKRAKTKVDGEWDFCVAALIGGDQRVISEAFGRVSETLRPNAEANARLISAAPELYEALEALVDQAGWRGDGEHDEDIYYCEFCRESHADNTAIPHASACLISHARAALAKARGE